MKKFDRSQRRISPVRGAQESVYVVVGGVVLPVRCWGQPVDL